MNNKHKLMIVFIFIIIIISCSGKDKTLDDNSNNTNNDNHDTQNHNYELLPDEYPKPEWWVSPPKDTKEHLYFKGKALNIISEDDSVNDAKKDALSEASRYFETFFVRKTTSSKTYYESDESTFYEESFEDAMESYSVVKFEEAKIVFEKVYKKKNKDTNEIVYDAYVIVRIKRDLVEPQTDEFVQEVVSATNAFLLKCDILRYDEYENKIETVMPEDSIYIGDYIKLIVEMNRPKYVYIFNLDNTGKLVAIYPRQDTEYDPYMKKDTKYQIPSPDTEFFVIEGEASGTEILDFIILEEKSPELDEIVKEINENGGGNYETYKRINELPVIKDMKKSSFVVREEKESLIANPDGKKVNYNSDDIVSFNPNVRKIVKMHRKF